MNKNNLFLGSDGVIKAWNLETYTHTKSTEESGNQITSLDFNNTGVYFATGGKVRLKQAFIASLHHEIILQNILSH